MPPRKTAATKSGSKGVAATKSGSKGAPKKRVAAIGFKLPDPIAPGLVVKDVAKQSWKIGKSIGQWKFFATNKFVLDLVGFLNYASLWWSG